MLPNITTDVFTVIDITTGNSRNLGETMYTIELENIVSGEKLKTYVVEEHKNYKHWQRVIENPDRYYFLNNLKLKEVRSGPNAGDYYINGDSRVEIVHETSDAARFETLVRQMRGEVLPPYLNKDLWG